MGEILVERDDLVGRVVISQPDRLNAMTLSMWRTLSEAVAELDADRDSRVIRVEGDGQEAFSAGADISEFADVRATPEGASAYSAAVSAALGALIEAQTPTVAVVRGVCAGGGAGIALACALRFADDRLRFSIPAARLGVVYEQEAIEALVRVAGASAALDILLSGRAVAADEARALGLVNAVAEPDALGRFVDDYIDTLRANAPLSMQGALVAVRGATAQASTDRRTHLETLKRLAIESDDYREGRQAFLEKRRPRFTGS